MAVSPKASVTIAQFTTLGVQAPIDVAEDRNVVLGLRLIGSITASVEQQLTEGGAWFPTSIVDATSADSLQPISFFGPVNMLRVNISAISGGIADVEVITMPGS